MFQCEPRYQYRIRDNAKFASPSTNANLTRGQFNSVNTGRFLGLLNTIDRKLVDVRVHCTNPECEPLPWWDALTDLDEFGHANCDICEARTEPYTGL